MDWPFLVTLFLIGLGGSFVSAMTGLGGAIVIVSALLYIPPMVGVGNLDMKQVSGITIIMVFFTSLIGTLTHGQHKAVNKPLVLTISMIYILGIPTRVALGSTMGIVFVSSIAGALGKLITFQVPYLLTAAVLVGTVPGARVGGLFSHKVPVKLLRRFLAVIISYAAIRMIYDAFK